MLSPQAQTLRRQADESHGAQVCLAVARFPENGVLYTWPIKMLSQKPLLLQSSVANRDGQSSAQIHSLAFVLSVTPNIFHAAR